MTAVGGSHRGGLILSTGRVVTLDGRDLNDLKCFANRRQHSGKTSACIAKGLCSAQPDMGRSGLGRGEVRERDAASRGYGRAHGRRRDRAQHGPAGTGLDPATITAIINAAGSLFNVIGGLINRGMSIQQATQQIIAAVDSAKTAIITEVDKIAAAESAP
jgi:hypothetical protein